VKVQKLGTYINENFVQPLCANLVDALSESFHAIEWIKDKVTRVIMMMSQMYKMGRSPKKITARNIMTIIQFSQNLMQCGWKSKDPYAQLPGFGDDECKKIKGIMNGKNLY